MNLPDLPSSSDEKFWEEAERHPNTRQEIAICTTHTKDNYMQHQGYIDNHNGTISCKFCPWGTLLPGYIKVMEDHLIDLRTLAGSQ